MTRPLPSGRDVALIMSGIQYLAACDTDHASVINSIGFSKHHTYRGQELARKPWLTVPEIQECARLVVHYRRQMTEERVYAARRVLA